MPDIKTDALFDRLKRARQKLFPIENSYLRKSPDYIKNTYLKLLCAVFLCADNANDEPLNIICRIIAGSGTKDEPEEYFRQALDATADEYSIFFEECQGTPIGYRLAFEAMVIMGFTCTQNQLKLTAHLCELLKIEWDKIRYIAARARAAIELSDAACVNMELCRIKDFPDEIFSGYKNPAEGKWLFKDKNNTVICSRYADSINIKELCYAINNADTPCLTLKELNINLKSSSLVFKDKDKVSISGCKFSGDAKHNLVFSNCGSLTVTSSDFDNFNSRAIVLSNVNNMQIAHSSFTCCIYHYSDDHSPNWEPLGGVIYSEQPKNVYTIAINNCAFTKCGGQNRAYQSYKSAVISNCDCIVKKCVFKECKNTYKNPHPLFNSIYIDRSDKKRTLFTSASQAINCTFEDSINFN